MIVQKQFNPAINDVAHSNAREKSGSHNRYISMKNVITTFSSFCIVLSKLWFALHKILIKFLVYSLDHGGLLTRLSVIDYRASLSSTLGQAVYLPIMFSVFGLTAGIIYWQADTHLQIITAYCGASIPSLLFLSSVLLNHINRSLDVSEKRIRFFKNRVFPVAFCLSFKTSTSAKPFIWKGVLFTYGINLKRDEWLRTKFYVDSVKRQLEAE